MLYRKTAKIEIVNREENGDYKVQNAGDDSDQWVIPQATFESTYEVAEGQSNEQCTAVSSNGYDDGFHRASAYLNMLVEVTSKTDHKLHTEIDEAVKKLKELAYA